MKGKLTRISTCAVCLSLSCLLTGSALAGDLTGFTTGYGTTDCTIPLTNADQVYTMGIARTPEQDLIVRYTLNLGTFVGTPALSVGGAGAAIITLSSGGDGSNQVEFDVDVTNDFEAGVTTLVLSNPIVLFPVASPGGTTMTLTIDLRDLFGLVDADGVHTKDLAVLTNLFGCVGSPLCPDISEFTELSLADALRFEESVAGRLRELDLDLRREGDDDDDDDDDD